MTDSVTIMDIVDIYKVSRVTVKEWIKVGHFGKAYGKGSGVFMGVDGRIRIKMKAFKKGMKKVELRKIRNVKLKQKLAAQKKEKKRRAVLKRKQRKKKRQK